MALRLAVDLKLIDLALAHSGPITLNSLAEKSNADRNLIRMSSYPNPYLLYS
jgi:hypothetical protein